MMFTVSCDNNKHFDSHLINYEIYYLNPLKCLLKQMLPILLRMGKLQES